MENSINISHWYGLFGNNLMQLAGSIFYAKCCEGKTLIYLPKNNFFNVDSKIEVEKEFDYEVKIPTNLQWTSHNYYNSISNYINFDDYSKFLKKNIISVYKKEIYSILDRSFNFDQYKHLDLDDTLSIHFRSGDAIGQSPHPAYVQSPWSYFEKILKKTNPKKVIICTGFGYHNTNINPCYNKIIEFCSKNNIEVDSRLKSLSEDVYILSHSKKVVIGGVSTFSLTSCYINNNCSDIYYPSFFNVDDEFKIFDPSVNLHLYKFDNYYEMGKWKFDLKTMLEYKEEKITEVNK